ncbi:hypothetical protein [Parerythrobacter lacustris]|uniref:Uncharacterized protein n=1 Tax=Parerythrobacter lacustris TaxID=2969984 RepID=A0ABT1XT98_9SPHN|nr:hypothetical protein [Parerythrobacter lacustris]MCR2834905.1 hypothetical protein [Parerythrobacter lacustris]
MANSFLERAMQPREPEPSLAPLAARKRSETVHRLQIGLSGIAAMVLLVALADTILARADQSEASAVPEAAATVEPATGEAPKNDPLAEAGVVPDLPTSPGPGAGATPTSPPDARESGAAQ